MIIPLKVFLKTTLESAHAVIFCLEYLTFDVRKARTTQLVWKQGNSVQRAPTQNRQQDRAM
jgi:hypothetical protein